MNMRSYLIMALLLGALVACRKNHDADTSGGSNSGSNNGSSNTAQPPAYDSTPTPFLQRTAVQRDTYHKDSGWLQLPEHYNSGFDTEKYPLLIFLNGRGEAANAGKIKMMLKWGIPKFLADSVRFAFDVNGKKQGMIVVCPQSENGYPSTFAINQTIDYMISKYRVDVSRIYLTGLSSGAAAVFSYLTYSQANAARIAAAVPMSSLELETQKITNLKFLADANTPVRVFCGKKDNLYEKNKSYVAEINKYSPGLAVFTSYGGRHGSWNEPYDPSHAHYNPNMYDWMLQYHK